MARIDLLYLRVIHFLNTRSLCLSRVDLIRTTEEVFHLTVNRPTMYCENTLFLIIQQWHIFLKSEVK